MSPVTESQHGRPKHRWWRIARWIGAGLVALVIVLAAGGALWNWGATLYYRHKYPAPGKMYTINGHPMHMYCTGSGSPALILDSGLGDDWTVWAKVQPTLSKTTQVCSYDRSGLGWTDEMSPDHDANTLADQLHALLKQAGIDQPVILMGHSMAGVYDRSYAARYPNDLAGLIFVDASSPDQDPRFKAILGPDDFSFTPLQWMNFFGIARVRGQCAQVVPGLEFERGFIYANNCKQSVVNTNAAEFKDIDRSSDETRHSGPFGTLPILVLSEDPIKMAGSDFGPYTRAQVKKVSDLWNGMQEDLKQLSTNGRPRRSGESRSAGFHPAGTQRTSITR
jgi:pimeloyl-ACP methyl ester carboxylesterase